MYFEGDFHMHRAARKSQFGQAIISVFYMWFSHESRRVGKPIWTSYYKAIPSHLAPPPAAVATFAETI